MLTFGHPWEINRPNWVGIGMRIKPFSSSTEVVLIGSFNPAIFQPAWFAANGMVGKLDAENAKIEFIHPEMTSIKFDQFRLQVMQRKFSIQTTETYPDTIKDLIQSCFGEGLPHSPISAMGINRT